MGYVGLWHRITTGNPHCITIEKYVNGVKADSICKEYLPKFIAQPRERLSDVSSPIGLFRKVTQVVSEEENERLERCLADLYMSMLYPHLRGTSARILIEGPSLLKLAGRLAYRHPRPDVSIAFVTVKSEFVSLPKVGPASPSSWDGPLPDSQQENLLRIYYRRKNSPIRVDLFAQGLGRFPSDVTQNGIPMGIGAKLDSLTEDILSFGDMLKNRDCQQEGTRVQENLYSLPSEESPLAARGASHQESTGLPNRSIYAGSIPVPRRAQDLSKAEAYNAVFGDIKSKKGQHRFKAFETFCVEDHITDSTTCLEFLRFLKQQIESTARRSVKVTTQQLRKWFAEFQSGELQ